MLTYDEKLQLTRMGLAVPGMSEEGKKSKDDIRQVLTEAGVYQLGEKREKRPARKCTREEPCDLDGGGLLRNLALTPGPVLLFVAFAVAVGNQAGQEVASDEEWVKRLERQAERSRARRIARQRNLAEQLEPVQSILGLNLVDDDGLPTTDAYVFLAVAVLVQLAIASAIVAPLQQAVS